MGYTPMIKQYLEVKKKCKDCILFFRLGDFYEMFFEDAIIVSKELELVLTGRDCGMKERAPMCGVPYHAANNYIARLVNKGFKVAICEQLEDPSLAKGIVKRDIIKVITPGTFSDSNFIDDTENNYIMSIYVNTYSTKIAICFSDISTGEFNCTEFDYDENTLLNEISKFNPKEILVQDSIDPHLIDKIKSKFNVSFTKLSEKYYERNLTVIEKQFCKININDFKQFSDELISVSISLLNYINETQKQNLSNISSINKYNIIDFLNIDMNSRKNLELTQTLINKTKKGSLLWIIDKTCTSMGGREIKKWLEQPLINKSEINKRLDSVEEMTNNLSILNDIRSCLKKIYDIERIAGKISSKSINARDMISLKNSISNIPHLKSMLKNLNSELLVNMYKEIDTLDDIRDLIDASILDNPSLSIKEGNIIKAGYDKEVDELRNAKNNGKKWIAELEKKERESTKIKSLKIGYNKVFGYFIEVRKSNIDLVPEDRYIRRQTLANTERYVTNELKHMEEKILGSEEKLISLEYSIFVKIRDIIEGQIDRMKKTSKIISQIDCICSLSIIALENNYCRPKLNEEGYIRIEKGRHPVIEKILPEGSFVENDTYIDTDENQLLILTGPNMAGKSTYMRQVALITIMAQIGSFIPAKSADISICDKIFTRIGASDDLTSGKSTFMVEMSEVSNILRNATNKSLVLLDEVGRGTSTYDGLSIAWAVIEYMCKTKKIKCKTLFATHYHELIALEGKIRGVKNYSISVKRENDEIVFLRKIVRGGADESYGIEVAKLAGLPEEVLKNAKNILSKLEKNKLTLDDENNKYSKKEVQNKQQKIITKKDIKQINFRDLETEKVINYIKNIDILNLTPMQGFNELFKLINKVKSL